MMRSDRIASLGRQGWHMTYGVTLFPSERGTPGFEAALNRRFNRCCQDQGLSPGLDIHSLRRSMDKLR